MEIDNSAAHTGTNSLKVIGILATGKALNAKVRHESVSVENKTTYTIAFWAKVDAEEGQSREVDISVEMLNDSWPGFYNKTIVLDSTDWKEYTDTLTITADSVQDVWVGLCVAESDVDFWIDDFRFFEGEPGDELDDAEIEKEPEQEAVSSTGKLSTAWGIIKSRH